MASLAAISQTNGKKVLAYSTAANLGLIVACGGVGTYGALWAGIMLMIFHAVTKSLMFLCVGTVEHNIGSKDIEDMDGLFDKMPVIAGIMMVGIAAMFLAPFGMLISKWAAMAAFIDSRNILLVMLICFGSSATIFYWTKWLGKLAASVAGVKNVQEKVNKGEWLVLGTLCAMIVVICLFFPVISTSFVIPHIDDVFYFGNFDAISTENKRIMWAMLAFLILLPMFLFGKTKKKIVPIYLAGVNKGDDRTFYGPMEREVQVTLRNRYMEKYFGEFRMNLIGVIAASIIIASIFSVIIALIGGIF